MNLSRFISPSLLNNGYYRRHGIRPEDITRAAWQKSSFSGYNGSCFEIARLRSDRIGVRDTKDNGQGPVLEFTPAAWTRFTGEIRVDILPEPR